MTNSSGTMPYIKSEPDDFANNPNRYMRAPNYGNSQNFGNQFTTPQDGASIDPSELSMQNNYGMNYNFGPTNMASSFSMGNSGYDDSELLESLDFGNPQGMLDDYSNMPQQNNNNRVSGSIPMNQQVYSTTPDGPPIQSPYLAGFDYSQFRQMGSIPTHMSPLSTSQFAKRPSMQSAHRKSSDQRSPLTPRTSQMASLQIGTPIRQAWSMADQSELQASKTGTPRPCPVSMTAHLAAFIRIWTHHYLRPAALFITSASPRPLGQANMHHCLPRLRMAWDLATQRMRKPRNVVGELHTMPWNDGDVTTSTNAFKTCHT